MDFLPLSYLESLGKSSPLVDLGEVPQGPSYDYFYVPATLSDMIIEEKRRQAQTLDSRIKSTGFGVGQT